MCPYSHPPTRWCDVFSARPLGCELSCRGGCSQSDLRSLLSGILAQASLRVPCWAIGMGEACVGPAGEYSPSHLQIVAQGLPEPRWRLCVVYR